MIVQARAEHASMLECYAERSQLWMKSIKLLEACRMSQGRVIDIMTFNSYSLQNYSFWKGTRIIGSSDCFR